MKNLLYISTIIFFFACSSKKYNAVYVPYINPDIEAQKIIDSLVIADVDTIITYLEACSGCISKKNVCYIFWVHNNKHSITKISQYSRFNILDEGFDFRYLDIVSNLIQDEILIVPSYKIFHYGYEKIFIQLNQIKINFEIKDYEKWQNENSRKVIFIDKFRSYLFNINDYEWIGRGYKTEKIEKNKSNK